MKVFYKITRLITVLAIAVAVLTNAAAAQLIVSDKGKTENLIIGAPQALFSDVDKADWFYDAVISAYNNKIMNGTENNMFSPYENLTRAMMVTILYRLAGSPETGKNVFSDVASGSWYEKAVCWGFETGVVSGTGERVFSPDEFVTREQIAVMLYNYYKVGDSYFAGIDMSVFADFQSASDWAAEKLTWAVERGLIAGNEQSQLAPQNFATRAETAAILTRLSRVK